MKGKLTMERVGTSVPVTASVQSTESPGFRPWHTSRGTAASERLALESTLLCAHAHTHLVFHLHAR